MTAEMLPVELLLRNLKLRPSMFFLDGSFAQYVAFLSGCDVNSEVTEGPLLDGFAEWIAADMRSGDNLTWPVLVLRSIWPDWSGSVSDWSDLDAIFEKRAVRALFDLLATFKGVDPAVLDPADDGAP
ncbi:hypothetical protein ACH427_03780 [Streptomyces sp. NPDC020379]|uniref:hypothetical protein n=1 Tax=Streptomyces sp. NPDC020379 TaxID=3365071 RepID=UPI00378E05FB